MLNSKFDLYKPEWLELVFKNRNQQYGAYEMRAHYGDVMFRAMTATFLIMALGAGAVTIISHSRHIEPLTKTVIIDVKDKVFIAQQTKEVKPKTTEANKSVEPAKAKPASMQNINYHVEPDKNVKVDPAPVNSNIASGPIDVIIPGGDKDVQNPIVGTPEGKGIGEAAPSGNDPVDINILQVMPEPVGGADAWSKFLQKNLRYPYAAQEQGVSGKVFLSFIIEKDGHLSDITVIRKANYGFDEEALRVLKLAPAWKPGIQNGQPVRVRYTIPINFQINE